MRVVIAGGGIGGLALAHGLRRAGIQVRVIERDIDLAATGGYRLHLAAPALRALRTLLPPVLVERLYAASAADYRGLAVRDYRARLLVCAAPAVEPGSATGPALDVDRATLRLLLADGLGDSLQLGITVTGFSAGDDGVSVRLRRSGAAGTTTTTATISSAGPGSDAIEEDADCEVLVAADGARSAVAEQLAGQATAHPTGFVGIAGWTPVEALDARARKLLTTSSVLAIGPGGAGLYAAWHDPAHDSPSRPAHQPDDRCSEGSPEAGSWCSGMGGPDARVIWGLIAVQEALRPALVPTAGDAGPEQVHAAVRASSPEQLQDAAAAVLDERRWTEPLRQVVERATLSTVGGFSFVAADPDRLAPWLAGRTTALGDAVHAVPPTGGRGAATAIEDAAALCTALVQASSGGLDTVAAVDAYEQRLRARGAVAVRESLQPLGWIRATATPAGAAAARLALPVAAAASAGARWLRRH